jgi:hypothetical protein
MSIGYALPPRRENGAGPATAKTDPKVQKGSRLCENAEAVEGSPLECTGQRRNRRPNGIYAPIQDAWMATT